MHKKIISHFQKVDPTLYRVINHKDKIKLEKSQDLFVSLCREIIFQQLSGKAGETIFKRFQKLFSKELITPQKVLKISVKKMRTAGPSFSKIRFIKGLAEAVLKGNLKLDTLDVLDNQTITAELLKIKGIGPWTAEMFLMFSMAREDIFSQGDLGLRKAIKKLYKLKDLPTKTQMEKITSIWSPYRTYACMILWRYLDTNVL